MLKSLIQCVVNLGSSLHLSPAGEAALPQGEYTLSSWLQRAIFRHQFVIVSKDRSLTGTSASAHFPQIIMLFNDVQLAI